MKGLYLHEIVNVTGGKLKTKDRTFLVKDAVKRVRDLNDSTVYFHLYKKRDISLEEFKKYKATVLVTEDADYFMTLLDDVAIIQVKDIDEAYWKFVEYYRSLFNIPIIGVTGTCGKTTTKEMIKHILSEQYKVQATYKSWNASRANLGYLLRIDESTQAAVFEMGVDWPGDLSESCRYFKPQIRILLNIGVYHLVGCKTPENYIKAKSEILDGMDPANDVIILNADDENIRKIDVSHCEKIVYFGFQDGCHWKAKEVKTVKEGISFTLTYENRDYEVVVPGLGQHNVYNALAALAAVRYAGVDVEEAIDRLKTFKHLRRRLELREGPGGCTILDDNWNNTPPSMEAALRVLKEIAGNKLKVAVLGFMYNLGTSSYAQVQYAKMGKVAAEVGVDILVIIGDKPKAIGNKAIECGMDKSNVYFISQGEAAAKLSPFLNKNTIVLLKAPEDDVAL
ncbi:UDP-N-acetylmuramoyl-tripeptide--D-alanyl-D-alanine ligase [Paenibacillus beijingensis]|uniref:UDP-N-acetylmuramoyl-tripeptide--D-alanyl-D-alanine ligase n=2 Tax=Paenibacillus beijingensis TaxID=1126833 RepID=A0A0D5NIU5_9BACL|nr:UDP-N-acetylmuramoyl-tripeptide--D-alanyl-D-alanine ligase [Paenibacillus beijingensis]